VQTLPNNHCCHLNYQTIEGYITTVDRIIYKLNNLNIPLPKPVLTVSEEDGSYLSCGFATNRGCSLGTLLPLYCVTSNCNSLKDSISRIHNYELERNINSLNKINDTFNSVLDDLDNSYNLQII